MSASLMRRRSLIVFGIFLVLQTVPIWMFSYFPSQDGPSHIYNAAILANYSKVAVYREFYATHLSPAGNVLTQLLLCLFLPLGPLAAGKLLLIAYAVLLPLAFRAVIGTVTDDPGPFLLFGFLLVPNFFLYFGFWNFCLSIPLMLFSLAYARKRRDRWTLPAAVVLASLSLLTYSAHLLSWAVLAMAVGVDMAPSLIRARGSGRIVAAVRQVVPGLIAVAIPALPALIYLRSGSGGVHFEGNVREQAWPLYAASFLRGLPSAGKWISTGFIVLVMVLILCALASLPGRNALASVPGRSRGRTGLSFLVCAGICGLACLFGPARAAEGAYINDRFALYAWIFVLFWLAGTPWAGAIRTLTAVALGILLIAGLVLNLRAQAVWNRELSEYASARPFITPGSTVLPIQMETQAPAADPMLHAVDLLTVDGAIDLRNYEASLPYFSVQFRRPIPIREADATFVVVYGGIGKPELQLYREQLENYAPIYVSQPAARVRVYRHR